jgi:hypothetical protein
MERIVTENTGNRFIEMTMEHGQGLEAAREGRLKDAEQHSRSAVEMALRAGLRERMAVLQAAPAVWNALYESKAEARRAAESALATADGREVDYAAGFALGLAGDEARAESLAEKLNKEFPEDTQVQASYVPTLRALAALHRNDPRRAIDLLEANRQYELGIPPLAFIHFYGNLYPVYVRGLAYLAMNRAGDAAAEFQRLLAHPALVAGDPIEAAARRQLARALALTGDQVKAGAAYREFLNSWSGADAGIPVLVEAKAEAAGLQ